MSSLLQDFPQPLSDESERTLLGVSDFDAVVLHSIRQAFSYVKRISRGGITDDEILSLSYLALTKAIRNFKSGRGRFITYSRPYLRGELASEWRRKDPVRNAAKHETPIPEDKYPQPLEGDSVEPNLEDLHWRELWEKIEPIMRSKLSSKEITALELRFKAGLNCREVGERMGGLTRSRIQQIQKAAILKIRRALPEGLGI